MRLVLLASCFALTTCATSKAIHGPDGTPHVLVTCGGVEKCYEKAAKDCGGKYKIINSTSETEGQIKLLVKCDR